MHVYFLSSDFALATDYVPQEEVIQTLAKYLSELTLTEERGVKFCRLPEKKLPQGFHVTYKRCSKRSVYEIWPGFTTILSKESSWRTDGLDEDSRESVLLDHSIYFYKSFFNASTPVVISYHDSFLPFL